MKCVHMSAGILPEQRHRLERGQKTWAPISYVPRNDSPLENNHTAEPENESETSWLVVKDITT